MKKTLPASQPADLPASSESRQGERSKASSSKASSNKAPSKASAKKPSSFYMKQMRAGLSAAGYVKHETWVLPENRSVLKHIEKKLRQPLIGGAPVLENDMIAGENWTIDRLFGALQALDEVTSNEIGLSLIQGAEPSIKLEMHDFGGLPIYIAVVGEQIIVDTVLVDLESINDVARFNDAVLRSREMFPLSSIGIESMPNGQTVYNMFGALSASSNLTNVVTEVKTLVDNVQRATEAFESFFN
ncbi:YjfI family protein [Pseudomonas chlororaphis]|uniref:YjfI family protein n=1 Tax=Pseudomonas chlororaphis TaxID=587753 RepID=UPI0021822AAA|nr:YjfI family protein [Pseudomonas chlororaphis]WDH25697.1 YjfI family protein [Pseudomonas chlororaphis]